VAANASTTQQTRGQQAQSKEEKKRIRQLERDLQRMEKALAEAAALLILRKEVQAIWGAKRKTDQRPRSPAMCRVDP
jgi:transposase